ncbi:hypothetical protein RRG08_018991 [Elysia crispata]|uniref:Uncharacterized protein n=1 Tax=Elysia crispata TaxID=231223 RepID=A0AAE1DT51_9GAST|nr:hypothetical protein RRG08_018991 [Elysia crispata]
MIASCEKRMKTVYYNKIANSGRDVVNCLSYSSISAQYTYSSISAQYTYSSISAQYTYSSISAQYTYSSISAQYTVFGGTLVKIRWAVYLTACCLSGLRYAWISPLPGQVDQLNVKGEKHKSGPVTRAEINKHDLVRQQVCHHARRENDELIYKSMKTSAVQRAVLHPVPAETRLALPTCWPPASDGSIRDRLHGIMSILYS